MAKSKQNRKSLKYIIKRTLFTNRRLYLINHFASVSKFIYKGVLIDGRCISLLQGSSAKFWESAFFVGGHHGIQGQVVE